MSEKNNQDSLNQHFQHSKIIRKSILSWLLFKWGKDVYDSNDKKIMTIEHSLLSKITQFRFPFVYSCIILVPITYLLFFLPWNTDQSKLFEITAPFIILIFFFLCIFPLPLSIIFRQKRYIISGRNRKRVGIISTNWRKSIWKISDNAKNLLVTIYFTKESFGKIETSSGEFIFELTFENIFGRRYPQKVEIDGIGKIERISSSFFGMNFPNYFLISSFKEEYPFNFLTISFCLVEKLLHYSVFRSSD